MTATTYIAKLNHHHWHLTMQDTLCKAAELHSVGGEDCFGVALDEAKILVHLICKTVIID